MFCKRFFSSVVPLAWSTCSRTDLELNLSRVRAHNSRPGVTFQMSDSSPFVGVSWDDFRSTMLMTPQECSMTGRGSYGTDSDIVPVSIDWRTSGAVTPVKNQGNCASSYAFAAAGAIEAQHKIQLTELRSVSEQQIIECSTYSDGCGGGLPSSVFEYVHHAGGINYEYAYPYTAVVGVCKFSPVSIAARTVNSFNITEADEGSIKRILANIGPVAVAFQVDLDFMLYSSGVYSSHHCRSGHATHAALIVGYDTDPNFGPYWLVKNSWGVSWGESGFVRIARGSNMCGIGSCASYPVLDSDIGGP